MGINVRGFETDEMQRNLQPANSLCLVLLLLLFLFQLVFFSAIVCFVQQLVLEVQKMTDSRASFGLRRRLTAANFLVFFAFPFNEGDYVSAFQRKPRYPHHGQLTQ